MGFWRQLKEEPAELPDGLNLKHRVGWDSCITPRNSASAIGRMEWPSPVKGKAVGEADFASEDQEFRFRGMNVRCLLACLCGDAKSAGIPEMR